MMLKYLAIMLALLGTQSAAQTNCTDRENATATLTERYGEARQSVALDQQGRMVEVWADLDGGGWTLLVTAPGGPTCLVAAGTNYEAVEQEPAGVDG
jgi:hypothetical protein